MIEQDEIDKAIKELANLRGVSPEEARAIIWNGPLFCSMRITDYPSNKSEISE